MAWRYVELHPDHLASRSVQESRYVALELRQNGVL